MELTREAIEKLANPTMLEATYDYKNCFVVELAKQLLAEIDKQKDDVWDKAPRDATVAVVSFTKSGRFAPTIGTITYTRELQKSPEREIAEKKAEKYLEYYGGQFDDAKERLVNDIESAINEYKEWEAER